MARKKQEFLLVDGYNIIFSWKRLQKAAEKSLDVARVKLSDTLCNYSGYTGENIILVFDAHKVNGGIENIEQYNNITVVYTGERETADHYIERTTKVLTKNKSYSVRVATSDFTEQIIIAGSGAMVVSAKNFEEEVVITNQKIARIAENRPIKNNLLSDNLDLASRNALEALRLNK